MFRFAVIVLTISICLFGSVLASADLEDIKKLIEQTKKDIKDNDKNRLKSDLELPGKTDKPRNLQRQINNFNKTTVKQIEEYDKLIKDYNKARKDAQDAKKENVDLYHEKARLEKLLDELMDSKIDFQTKARQQKPQFINIKLSKPCIAVQCMTYRDLVQFDTSIQKVTGKLVDDGTDIHREPSNYKQFWNYFPKNYTTVNIDPPAQLLDRGALIEIFPAKFVLATMNGDPNQSLKKGYRLEWHDMGHNIYCKHSIVTANLTAIARAIKYYESGCSDPGFFEKKIEMPPTPFKYSDSVSYQRMQDIKNRAALCKLKC